MAKRYRAAAIVAFTMMLFAIVSPKLAFADVTWISQTDDDYAAYVYPYYMEFESQRDYQSKLALCDYAGYDWDSFSEQVKNSILEGNGGSNPFTRALGKIYNMSYDGGGGGGHAFGDGLFNYPQISTFGGPAFWYVSMSKADYDQLRSYIAYWAYPRDDETPGGQQPNKVTLHTRYSTNSNESYLMLGNLSYSAYYLASRQLPETITAELNDIPTPVVFGENIQFAYSIDGGYGNSRQFLLIVYAYNPEKITSIVKRNDAKGIEYIYQVRTPDTSEDKAYTWSVLCDYVFDGTGVTITPAGNASSVSRTTIIGFNYFLYSFDGYINDIYTPTPDPTPTPTPDPPEPVAPTPVEPEPVTPTGSDVISYLNDILDALAEHCVHLQNAINNVPYEITSYLRDALVWLDSSFAADIGSAKDTIIRWLKLIYSRIKSLDISVSPSDDGEGFWSALTNLIMSFLGGLLGGLAGVIASLGNDAARLTTKFPFSIPWDLYAMLNLFVAVPTTPVFDLTWNFGNNIAPTIHFDFHEWDGLMSAAREVQRVTFGFGLAKLTSKLIGTEENS